MRKLAILLISCSAFGATPISLSTNTVSWKWLGASFGDGPWSADIPITGTGTLSLGACTGSALLCTAFTGNPTVFSASTAPATLTLGFNQQGCCSGDVSAFVGTTTSHITVVSTDGCAGNCTIDVTYVALPRSSMDQPTMIYPGGTCNGCSAKTTSNGWAFWDNDLATWLPSQVPGGTFPFPGAGNTYVDGNFGTVLKQLNDPLFCTFPTTTCLIENMANDAAGLVWNADNSMFVSQTYNGFFHVWNSVTGTIIYGISPTFPAGGFVNWDQINPNVFYYFSGTTIRKITLTGTPNFTDTLLYTYGGTGPILNGSNTNVTPDEWWTFFSTADRIVCIINLGNLSQVPCTDPIDPAIWGTKSARITPGYDSVTGYRYIGLLMSDFINPPGVNGNVWYRWKPGDAKIAFSHFTPKQRFYRFNPPAPPNSAANNGVCSQTDFLLNHCQFFNHEAVVQIGGRQFLFSGGFSGASMPITVNLQLIAAGSDMATPHELGTGGGMYAAFSTGLVGDNHVSCATKVPVCLLENDQDVIPPPTVWWISSATTASPIHITICTDGTNPNCPGGISKSNGDTVLITAIKGLTGFVGQVGANATCLIGNLAVDKKSMDCVGSVGAGTFVADSGIIETNDLPSVRPYQTECLVFDYTNLLINGTFTVTRCGKSRAIALAGRYSVNGYNEQGHHNISPDGKYMLYETNFGFSDQLVLVTGLTGYTPPPLITGSGIFGQAKVFGKARILP